MLRALLIADQQRLHALVAASLGGCGVQLTIISSLASGIEQAAANHPDLLFVQGRLSGLSTEIVSRHVAGHVDLNRTISVIFVDPDEDPGMISPPQICLDLTLPDATLENHIVALLKAAQSSSAKESAPPPATASDEFIPDASPMPAPPGQIPVVPPPDGTVATRFEAELDTELARRQDDAAAAAPTPADVPPSANVRPSVGQAEAAELAARSRRLIVTGAILTTLIAGALLATLLSVPKSPPSPKVTAAARPATPPAMVRRSTATRPAPEQRTSPPGAALPTAKTPAPLRDPLPSFVPADGRDPAYATANPGWERYQDARQEYKVFWEGERLMAIQVIDKSGAGLSPAFFTKSMQELAGVRDYRMTGREVRDNHLVKKGLLGKRGSIIIYKDRGDSVLQAFVIHFEQDRNRRR